MFDRLKDLVANARDFLSAFDASAIDERQAADSVELFAELERLATAGRTMAGRRVEKSYLWSSLGYRTPAQWMASHAQTTVAAAISTLETGRTLEHLPATREAFAAGALSGLQAAEIARAAAVDPNAEGTLLEAAKTETVAVLRERCREVMAASLRDPDADERLHRSRYLRHWMDADGAFRLDARLTPDAGAKLSAALDARTRKLLDEARRSRSSEGRQAYAADALVSLADTTTPGPRAIVHVHIDEPAWSRGSIERAETCQIPGMGPISVAAARRLAEGGIVKTVLTKGSDVRAVAHLGRTIPARLRTALEARDQTCVVPGCDTHDGLEIDHIVPLAEGGPTKLGNLARLCHWHHSLKTHRGWRLDGGPGRWRWHKPDRGGARAGADSRSPPR